jgi:hypothetical protein
MAIEKLTQPTALQEHNSIIDLAGLYQLLNQAMQQGAMVQGAAATDIAAALNRTADLLKILNTNSGNLQSEIAKLNQEMETLRPWMEGFGIAAVVLGIVAPMGAGAFSGSAQVVVSVLTKVMAALAGIASGGVGIKQGLCQLEVGKNTGDLAHQNGTISLLSGSQQTYQNTSKWMTNQIGETFSRMGDMAKTVSSGIRQINEGLNAANRDLRRGIAHSQ